MEPMKSEQIVFRCSKNLKDQMKYVAKSQGLILSDCIRNACEVMINDDLTDGIIDGYIDKVCLK